jgi:hypothetical protein
VEILDNVYEMIIESKMTYGVETWGLEEAWEETDKIHRRFCKKLIQVSRSAVNGAAELEFGRNDRRGEVLCAWVEYWIRIMHLDTQDLVRECYEWQIHNLNVESWARKLKAELDK